MSINLEKVRETFEIPEAFKAIIGEGDIEVFRFFDDCVYDEGKGYNTYKLVSGSRSFVLKKYEAPEDRDAEVGHYRLLSGLPVPQLLGSADCCILMDYVEGDDLKFPTDVGIIEAAKSLAAVMNAYPMGREYDGERYKKYLARLERRSGCLGSEPELAEAFAVFFERQKEIPLTLSNADLLPINVLFNGKKATIIDWEFGGFLPYALDIARFIVHSTPTGEVTSFRMSDEQKKLFSKLVYEKLQVKPEPAVYERDLLLAELNERIEILEYYFNEPSAERGAVFEYYYPRAAALARKILKD